MTSDKNRIYYLLDAGCGKNCNSCYLSSQKKLSAKDFHEASQDIVALLKQGFDVRVTGADLIQYSHINEIIEICEQDYLLGDIASVLENIKTLICLRESGLKKIFLTSPFSNHVKNDDDLFNAVKAVRFANLEPILTYVIGRSNKMHLADMINESLYTGVRSVRFMKYMPAPGGENNDFLSDQEVQGILETIYSLRDNIPKNVLNIRIHGHFGTWFRKEKGPVCFAGEKLLIIGLDNNVYPCEFLMYPKYILGNWSEREFNPAKTLLGLSNYDCKYKQIEIDKKQFEISFTRSQPC